MKCWLAIDIEKAGDDLETPVIAVGLVVGQVDGLILETRKWCVQCDEKDMEPRCKTEFWDKQQDLFHYLQQDAKPAAEVWPDIGLYLDSVYRHFQIAHVLSDNPAYDVGQTDYNLKKYAQHRGMRYGLQGEYHAISDPTEQFKGLPKFVQQWVTKQRREFLSHYHTRPHDPVCDARGIYAQMLFVHQYRKNLLSWQNYLELSVLGVLEGVKSLAYTAKNWAYSARDAFRAQTKSV